MGKLLDEIGNRRIVLDTTLLESWRLAAVIGWRQLVQGTEIAREETAAERAVGDKSNTQLATCGQHAALRLPRPQGIFTLHCRYRMHRAGSPQRLDAAFGQADMTELAGASQF